ncbi:hypothetical protein FB446DRAFT_698506 [Lentinula raphanica]|nr:hypothetical protein FB446DRAFT_698506 [Lentinula raphanica]
MSTEENVIGTVSARCQKIVEDANAGRVTFADARHKLLLERLPEVVLKSYLVQFQQPIGGEGSDQLLVGHEDGGVTPGGLDVNQREEFRQKRAENLGEGGSHSSHGSGGESSQRVEGGEGGGHNVDPLSGLANFGPRKERSSELAVLEQQLKAIQRFISGDSGSVSVSTLDSLPHLREKARSTGDSHIDQTLRTKRIYLNEQNFGALIDLFQTRYLPEPLPRSIWKLILKDEYISFEKLLAGIDPSYDHQDEGRDFGGGYTLVKKDHLSARQPVVSESDWNRAFDAWKNGVIQAFPHRKDELTKYRMDISNLFRNFAHDPSIPILADHEVRQRYHKGPFRLDDGTRTQAAVMALVHRTSVGGKLKRALDSSSPTRSNERSPGAICLNWNSGRCDDPCINGRRHGTCSICEEKHRAVDSLECEAEFITRRFRNFDDRELGFGSSPRF